MATIKTVKATLEATFPYDNVPSPMALAAAIEAAMAKGKEQLDDVMAEHSATNIGSVTCTSGIVNVREPKAKAAPVAPVGEPVRTDIVEAVEAAGTVEAHAEEALPVPPAWPQPATE